MKKFSSVLVLGLITLASSCGTEEKEWSYQETVNLGEVRPIGLALTEEGFWISDGDNNRLVQTDREGKVARYIDSLERPMHLDVAEGVVYVPQYGNDRIGVFAADILQQTQGPGNLDAPAGVSVVANTMAVADFYNNQVHYKNEQGQWTTFGKKGSEPGEFLYPTDVQITQEGIWVADAYNHRAQLIDFEGQSLAVIGEEQDLNAATGIWVTETEVFLTDFENDRVWVFNKQGDVLQLLDEGVEKPTDMISEGESLWVANFRKGELLKYTLTPVQKE